MSEIKISPRARANSRRNAVQALYQWAMSEVNYKDVLVEYTEDVDKLKKADVEYFRTLFKGAAEDIETIDASISEYIDRKLEELDPVEHAVLRMGCYELKHHIEVPYRVVINEAVELAKLFGAEDSHKYVNGIMDKLAQALRAAEFKVSN